MSSSNPLNSPLRSWWIAIGLCLTVTLVHGTALRDVWTIDPDAAAYVGLGRSLAAGDGYVLDAVPHAKYPPGAPLLFAAVFALAGPEAYAAAHALLVALLALAAVASWRLALALGCPPVAAGAVGLCVALSQTLFDLSVRYLRTEVPFLLATVLAFLALRRALSSEGRPRHVALAGLAVLAALSVRLAGVTLLIVPAAHLLWPAAGPGGRRRALTLLAIGGAGLAAWMAWGRHVQAHVPDAPDYGAELVAAEPRDLTKVVRADMPTLDASGALDRVIGNLFVLARASGVLLTNDTRSEAALPLGAALLASILAGLGLLLRGDRARRDAVLYVVATLGLYLIWPFNQKHRFYVPLLPFLLVASGHASAAVIDKLAALASRDAGRRLVIAAPALAGLLLALRRSDTASVLGRWSPSYAALLGALAVSSVALALWTARRPLPRAHPAQAWLLVALFAVTLADDRWLHWPDQVAAHAAHREQHPRSGALARIDVHPLLEEVAVWLAAQPPGTVLMTDVPKLLGAMSGRRCVPFVYTLEPPDVLHGDASHVFYTGELPEAAGVLEACAERYDVALELPAVDTGAETVTPTVRAVRR